MPKLLFIVGARPQFIKLAPLLRLVRPPLEAVLVHTGQHYDPEMSENFFREFSLPDPDHHLGVGSATHGVQTGRIMERLDPVLLKEKPAMVVVFGDTNSTLAGALCAAKQKIPVAHVEAGLRSFTRIPEEINRRLTDHLAALLLAPSEVARRNLEREGIIRGVRVVGDIGLDAVQRALERPGSSGIDPPYLVLTLHREENTDDPSRLASILDSLRHSQERVIFPCHPRTRAVLEANGLEKGLGSIEPGQPVGYTEMLRLVRDARLLLTDSGGLQKEAYYLGVPCLTLRGSTEWVETVENGWNRLVDADPSAIRAGLEDFRPPRLRPPLYGDGRSAEAIVQALQECAATEP
ncbi:MAG: UDP-N-acetylglucosamine 2-epimerase (non-hydrolyzing) [Armatimonadetes bacterium]|nr:UDP-N-acetylglucosamine 2-epimerase (non-hydrolyzing) [Armatimonadota bacterium]